jgi:hypothetical protein
MGYNIKIRYWEQLELRLRPLVTKRYFEGAERVEKNSRISEGQDRFRESVVTFDSIVRSGEL